MDDISPMHTHSLLIDLLKMTKNTINDDIWNLHSTTLEAPNIQYDSFQTTKAAL